VVGHHQARATEQIGHDCNEAGVRRVWMHQSTQELQIR
jgi:hypothetical protein